MRNVNEKNVTEIALKRYANCDTPRRKQIMASLIRHLHDFVRDVELTEAEWMGGIDFLTRTGKMSDEKRQEFILLSDVLGVSILVNAINNRKPTGATPSTVLGPFHIDASPEADFGGDMSGGAPGEPCYVIGRVLDMDGKPIPGAVLDSWQADGKGLYEAQIPGQDGPYLRAKYRAGSKGEYLVRTVMPLGYSVPVDGPVGEMLGKTDIVPFRPAHIHFIASAPGFESVVMHIFRGGDPYIDKDVVFGVKEELISKFKQQKPGVAPDGKKLSTPFWTTEYDIVLNRAGAAKKSAKAAPKASAKKNGARRAPAHA